MLKATPKFFELDIRGKTDRVSIDRLKKAVIPDEEIASFRDALPQPVPSSLGEESSTKEITITESLPPERSEAKITQPLKRGRPTKAVQEQRAEERRDERARLDLEERERQRNYDAEFPPISTRSGRISRQRVRL